jgi:hypothetical protein
MIVTALAFMQWQETLNALVEPIVQGDYEGGRLSIGSGPN